jgi:tRNA(Ile)-lysidine synthase
MRGRESDGDEQFVKELAESYKVPFYPTRFNTAEYARRHAMSVQMAARELRYKWFDELAEANDYPHIATAHQLDDQVETFFINLLRGTGISGLHGIQIRNGKIIRPLLFATRDEINKYAGQQNLEWREDNSNSNRNYLRNRIRLDVLPTLKEISPGFMKKMGQTFHHIRETEIIFRQKIEEGRVDLVEPTPTGAKILISWLDEFDATSTWLYELLKPYDFTFPVVEEIVESLSATPGKFFYSPTHRLIRDRDYLYIEKIGTRVDNAPAIYYYEERTSDRTGPAPFTAKVVEGAGIEISKDPSCATLDYDKLTFPLILRHWRHGDWFIPFGMKGAKKLSDFFIDQKVSIPDKENKWILASGEDIVWVVGMRIDNRFRISSKTKKALVIQLEEPVEEPRCFLGF